MSLLKLIGLGLSSKFITQKAIDELSTSDFIYLDSYTSLSCDINEETVSTLLKKEVPIYRANRTLLENNFKNILSLLDEGKNVAIATIGDPMIATTHSSLVSEVKNRGHGYIIVPGVSVHCYIISKSLLSSYRFGKSVTIVYPFDNKVDTTPYKTLKENQERNLHTIFYLDIRDNTPMNAVEAINLLIKMEEIERKNVLSLDDPIIIGERLGCEDEEVVAMKVHEVFDYKFKPQPHIIVYPSKSLHFMELEGLKCLMKK
ncbi:diphthine synthase [Stygiolobus caldivivus]|uniref:Diphthine synthase n=1 Tax=Stygiolobus caldivivus TaxID=2824673 RepID=A0A8D5U7S2_9CREN|nr:diphthine synthase [Stygiolobus caldivivus]BCU71156.1 diphthine synthase [Stygiolobus caldivivus]